MKFHFLLFLGLFYTALTASAQEKLTNKDVVSMTTAKVAQDLILTKMTASSCDFNLGSAALVELKTARVSEKVVKAMFRASPPKVPLKNEDVIQLNNADVSRSIILEAIKVTPNKFDTSVDGLVKLTIAKVPDAIVKEMLKSPSNSSSATSTGFKEAMNTAKPANTVSQTQIDTNPNEAVIWDKVIITNIADEVKNLTKVGDISVSASRLYGKQARLREEAIEKLKKEGAKKGATIVYIQSENFAPTPLNTVSLSGVAYKKK